MAFQSIIEEIENNLKLILADLSVSTTSFTVEVAKPGFGDVSSNIAFLLAKEMKKSPKEIAKILSISTCKRNEKESKRNCQDII